MRNLLMIILALGIQPAMAAPQAAAQAPLRVLPEAGEEEAAAPPPMRLAENLGLDAVRRPPVQDSYQRTADGIFADSFRGGLAWGTHLRAAQAHRLRLHLSSVRLPAGTHLWVWGLGEEPAHHHGHRYGHGNGEDLP
jgi:hypothetical protein